MITESQAKMILIDDLNVSRETMEDLQILCDLLIKWNKTINLVSKSTILDIWTRHILDSAQAWQQRPKKFTSWVDMGSGGGFPALVLAILAKNDAPSAVFHLIESDGRKCAFLRNVSRETSLNTQIHTNRIENSDKIQTDVISARALASVDKLLDFAEVFKAKDTFCLFLKGQSYAKEIDEAAESWRFQWNATQSLSDNMGVILKIWNIERVSKEYSQ